MALHDPSAKYLLLQQVVALWLTFCSLLVLIRYKFPHSKLYHVTNVGLAIASVAQIIALVAVSLLMVF